MPNIQDTAKLVQEIASASEEQAKEVTEINEAMKKLNGAGAKAAPNQRNWSPPLINSTKYWKKLQAKFQSSKVNKSAYAAIKNLEYVILKVLQINRLLRQPWPASNGS